VAEQRGLEGVVSKRRDAPYRSGRDWPKIKTTAWREANRERWRLFEAPLVALASGFLAALILLMIGEWTETMQ
jgi:hypothetical protein